MMRWLAIMLFAALVATPAVQAETVVATRLKPSSFLDLRIEQLVAVLNDTVAVEDFFTPSFLVAVPPAQIEAIAASLSSQYGKALQVTAIERAGPNSATVTVEYERAVATIDITVEPAAPNKVAGLLAKGFAVKGDDIAKITADFTTLPGRAGFLVQRLDGDSAAHQLNAQDQFAIASTFKLYVLAELVAQVESGQRKWSDVVPLSERSYSSPATVNWPRDTPVTLQTLATWMISVSDNAATDTLIRLLGRSAIEEKLASIGHGAPDRMLPMLTTVEAFVLKSNPVLRQRFEQASEAQQRDLLDNETAAVGYDQIDFSQLGSGPVATDTVEWFASAADIVVLMNHIRRMGNKTALDILAVNKGVPAGSAAKWQYLGYKGGSEPGVISMSFLAQSKVGEWYAISGSWNNPAAEVDNAAFAALMTRLLDHAAR